MCQAWLRLWRTPGVGPRAITRILEEFPDLDAFLAAPRRTRERLLRRPDVVPAEDDAGVRRDLDWLAASERHHVITLSDASYPQALRALPSPPAVLYADGDPELLSHPQIGIVGSRKPTPDGNDNAYEFARHLAGMGIAITSGLALGVDAAAHRGALDGGGHTVAVVATGPERVYPARNAELARNIASAGVVVTELPVGTGVRREHFPRRNRLISGLTQGVLVVEAGLHSGSLITAQHALDQGREVYAIPGSIHNPLARGCHRLIRDGAKLVETARDILEELPPPDSIRGTMDTPRPVESMLDTDHARVLDALGDTPQPLDVLVQRTGLTLDTLSSILLILELKGLAELRPGGRYARVERSGYS